jgi:4-methyl-5(b-hydroxyethyl)-thiazole monophosphate biosynthesis
MPRVLLPLAPGFEELEAVTIIDLLRRAGVDVITAGLVAGPIQGSRHTSLVPDTTLEEALRHDYDMLVLPGGEPGATNLQNDARIAVLIEKMQAANKGLGAICAAPRVLAAAGVLDGKRVSCYPGAIDARQFPQVQLTTQAVVSDGNITTSRGPGTAMDFALTLIERLVGKTAREDVEGKLLRPWR